MKPLRRGMSLADRVKLRQQALERQLRLAYQRAGEYGLSEQCRLAMAVKEPGQAKELHDSCRSEDTGGTGCLCPHHDVATGVVSGVAPVLCV